MDENYWWNQRYDDLAHALLLREAGASTRMDKNETINLGPQNPEQKEETS